jgi:ketosteroid isomerase-like protein
MKRTRICLTLWLSLDAEPPYQSCNTRRNATPLGRGAFGMTNDHSELEAADQRFNEAMVSNDPAQIAECITPDWVLVTPARGPIPGAELLQLIGNGTLTHDMMVKKTHHIRQSGDFATVTGRGQNTGTFQGAPISADEWITDVYCRQDGKWRCTLTHLTPATGVAGGT